LNYEEQQKYFQRGRTRTNSCLAGIAASSLWLLWAARGQTQRDKAIFGLIVVALLVNLAYTPDYLNLSVDPLKKTRWATRIRSRVVLVVFLFAMAFDLIQPRRHELSYWWWLRLAAPAWLAMTNFVTERAGFREQAAGWRWFADWLLILTAIFFLDLHYLISVSLLAAAAQIYVFSSESEVGVNIVSAISIGSIVVSALNLKPAGNLFLPSVVFMCGITVAAQSLAQLSRAQRDRNAKQALDELSRFTSYDEGRIRGYWATSNQTLAYKWQTAKPDENDPEKVAEWYRENSELYMFAISAYNLEYKRIKSNLAMMRYGSGKCLDYGAGNGELILEMARRGHPAVYYDVEGTSMLFARSRAEQRKLNVEFCTAKDCLRETAARKGFDTIFSFDVLEHIPDLAGELDFLASLLAPGGLMVFDVPAGSTKAHPMHLNHDLNVRRHMLAKGMVEEKLGWSFRKQEKYLFRKPA
jgi:2-polyprenyl-3-methyl-5-hydroxy-6-metoxy-1,4-benzoquinol methylase